jgi:two-component system chemotaxis sensor kinase CheA
MNPLMQNFIGESRELIEQSTRSLLQLETQPEDKETINELFRLIHTVKGASGIIENIVPFTELAHRLEDMLQKARDGVLVLTSEQIDVLLTCCDQFLLWLDDLEANEALSDDAQTISRNMIATLAFDDTNSDTIETNDHGSPTQDEEIVTAQWLADRIGEENQDKVAQLEGVSDAKLIIYRPYPQCFFLR